MQILKDNTSLAELIAKISKYQKVMLVFDNNATDAQIDDVYKEIKDICIFNKLEIIKDNSVLNEGYRTIIFLCSGSNFLKFNYNRSEFFNIFIPLDNVLMPFCLDQNSCFCVDDSFLLLAPNMVDQNLNCTLCFNNFYNYLDHLTQQDETIFHSHICHEINQHSNLEVFRSIGAGTFFISLDILKNSNLHYSQLSLLEYVTISGFSALLNSFYRGTITLADIYKISQDDHKIIDKFYSLFKDESLYNILKINMPFILPKVNETRHSILNYLKYCKFQKNDVLCVIESLRQYAIQKDSLISLLLLFNVI